MKLLDADLTSNERPLGVTIRYGKSQDASLLAKMGAETFYDAYVGQLAADALEAFTTGVFSPELQAAELADPAMFFLIVEVEGEAAGYAALQEKSRTTATGARELKIARIYLRQAWIGQGLGSVLMQACLEAGRARGYDGVWLEVWEENGHALAFYRKWGFEQVGTASFHFGSERQTDLVLWRGLRGQGELMTTPPHKWAGIRV